MTLEKWQFPLSSGGEIKGISSGDEETFKEFPFRSFARELLQNSIDVRFSDEEPVRVEFQEFNINKREIPGFDDFLKSLYRCKELWKSKDDYVKKYQEMIDYLENNEVIPCLRISDFNTTGLVGIESDSLQDNNYLALIKGTGFSSKKKGVTGGSKGVGKNASFGLSKLKMIFYSTKTDSSKGTIGVAKLVSGYADDMNTSEKRKITQGTGYFSVGEDCGPILKLLPIDYNYTKRENYNGTDVFVIGLQKNDKWDKEIIKEIINSFMVAIKERRLEVSFNGNEINADTLSEMMELDYIKSEKSIVAQYEILFSNSNDVRVFDIETELGCCTMYLKLYSKSDEKKATNKCYMVRYPGMYIQAFSYANYNISAMCIIRDDKLGKTLLSIENPQHTSWQLERIENAAEKREIKNIINNIKEQINDNILSVLKSGEALPIDPLGAGDYLPDIDDGENSSGEGNKSKARNDEVTTTKFKVNETREKNPNEEADDGNGLQPVEGSAEDNGTQVDVPTGNNSGKGGNFHPGSEQKNIKEGESILFKNAKLKGVRYKVISIDKLHGKIRIILTSPIDADNCYLRINMLDDSNTCTNVEILSMYNNGLEITSIDKIEFGPFKIKTNEKVVLDVSTNIKEFFGCEVKIICK